MNELELVFIKNGEICIKQATKTGYIKVDCERGKSLCDLSYPNSKTRRGRVQGGGLHLPNIDRREYWNICIRKRGAINDVGTKSSFFLSKKYAHL